MKARTEYRKLHNCSVFFLAIGGIIALIFGISVLINETPKSVSDSANGNLSLLICIICIIFAIISFLLWLNNVKSSVRVPETTEFYPPENLDASQIGYLYKKDKGRKLTVALIIELASKGFIKIVETGEVLTQKIIKTKRADIEEIINREVKIRKVKDYKHTSGIYFSNNKWIESQRYANLMFGYFRDGDECIITRDFDNFYKDADYLIKNNFIKIEYDTANNYPNGYIDNEFRGKSKMTKNEELVYNKLFQYSDEIILSENYSFYKVFDEVVENIRNEFDDKINDLKACKNVLISSLGFAVCSLLWGLAYYVIDDLSIKLNFMYILSAVSNVFILLFSILMKTKNSYGEQMMAKINGFRNYIKFAEKDQIDMLSEKNPNYFYDILPYAYTLDVTEKWIEKFENIPTPVNDMGDFKYYNVSSIEVLYMMIYYPSNNSFYRKVGYNIN